MAENENHSHPEPPRAMREPLHPPGPMRRTSTIPPPPLPVSQQHLPMPIPTVDEDCVTKRFYVNVFQPVDPIIAAMSDADVTTVDSIRITPEDTPQVSYREPLFDIDEDAVTKEIRIQRLTDLTSGRTDNSTAMRVRTLPTDDTLWRKDLSRRPERSNILNRLDALRSVFPSVRASLRKLLTVFSPVAIPVLRKATQLPRPLKRSPAPKDDRNALQPAGQTTVPAVDSTGFSIAISEPPKIAVNAVLLRRADKHSLLIRGRASHPIAIRDIMVFADKKKILYLSNAMREDAGYMEFSADVPLIGAVNSILVVARHDDHVMGSQSLMIKKSN
jgi:hypothetical protein